MSATTASGFFGRGAGVFVQETAGPAGGMGFAISAAGDHGGFCPRQIACALKFVAQFILVPRGLTAGVVIEEDGPGVGLRSCRNHARVFLPRRRWRHVRVAPKLRAAWPQCRPEPCLPALRCSLARWKKPTQTTPIRFKLANSIDLRKVSWVIENGFE